MIRKRRQEDGREKRRRNGKGDVEISPKKEELSLEESDEKV